MYYNTVLNMQYVDTKELHKFTLTAGWVFCSFQGTGIELLNYDRGTILPTLDPELHKSLVKHCFISGSLNVPQNSCEHAICEY